MENLKFWKNTISLRKLFSARYVILLILPSVISSLSLFAWALMM